MARSLRLAMAVVGLAGLYLIATLVIRIIDDLAVCAVVLFAAFVAFKVDRSRRR
jgi:hypothetical protein